MVVFFWNMILICVLLPSLFYLVPCILEVQCWVWTESLLSAESSNTYLQHFLVVIPFYMVLDLPEFYSGSLRYISSRLFVVFILLSNFLFLN